ncbi:nucleolar protein 11 [Thrips palmi]|uniref:Nucleolar protein 11 n=1 Tax=Thrips palmi TaxID=161013 RepID=A0A6P8ZZX5_THRPL|nr:nucleolar protein 11 [Thrips palmi]
MAKLNSCYPLCPLIDRSPIGVTSDSDSGCAIVTLGKNIVIRYTLADQKQASSWSSKDKLTAPVIYDHVGKKYVAVFNQSIIKVWDNTDVDLNKLKKHKFDHPIHSLVSRERNAEPVVIFKNGASLSFSQALVDRKKNLSGSLPTKMSIKECFFIRLDDIGCIAIVAENDKGVTSFVIVEVDSERKPLHNIPIVRPDKKLLGLTTMQAEGTAFLVTFWSDGQLFSLPLAKSVRSEEGVGSSICTLNAVSVKNAVAMTQIATNHLAIYGADPSEEGAMLVIVNTQFMLVQAHQHYKMFSNNTNLWTIGPNLLLVVGHSLAVVPFLLDTEHLCALIGTHKPLQLTDHKASEVEQVLEMTTVSWDKNIGKKVADTTLKDFQKMQPVNVKMLADQGYSQAMLCEKLVASYLEETNLSGIVWLLQFLPDFPESALVTVLAFCLDTPPAAFRKLKYDKRKFHYLIDMDGDSQNGLVELSDKQRVVLDIIIRTSFSEAIILPHLRSKLNLQHCLALLQYIAQCLPQIKNTTDAQALMRWAAVLLDSHYQQLLLSTDECVSSTVHALKDLVESQVEYIDELKVLDPILRRIQSGQALQKPNIVQNMFYSIETLRLY